MTKMGMAEMNANGNYKELKFPQSTTGFNGCPIDSLQG